MKIFLIYITLLLASMTVGAQNPTATLENSADKLLSGGNKLRIGGYAQIDYNQPIVRGQYSNGKLDVHRLVMLFNYKFSEKTQFLTEIEFEHVKEVYIEQAFLQHRFNKFLNFRAGLMLVPMGIINEYHEPTTYNGVERPNLDKYIIPTTWREIGAGFSGRFESISLKYQAYIFNGFKSYDRDGLLSSSSGLRSGRQKGAESTMSSPTMSIKFDFFGIPGLNLGLASYLGKTQSTLYKGLDRDNAYGVAQADSSVVNVAMLGIDARYTLKGLRLRGQFINVALGNVDAYNHFAGSEIGNTMRGYYIEAAYDLFKHVKFTKTSLIPFIRFEQYDTQHKVGENINPSLVNDRTDITLGLGWKLSPGAILKADYQWFLNEDGGNNNQLNIGVGIWFN